MDIIYTTTDSQKEFFVERYQDGKWYICYRPLKAVQVDYLSAGTHIKAAAEKELVKTCDKLHLLIKMGYGRVQLIRQAIKYERKARAAGVLSLITIDRDKIVEMAFYQFDSIDIDVADNDNFQFVCYRGNEIAAFFHVTAADIIATTTDCVILTSGLLEAFIIKRRAPRAI